MLLDAVCRCLMFDVYLLFTLVCCMSLLLTDLHQRATTAVVCRFAAAVDLVVCHVKDSAFG